MGLSVPAPVDEEDQGIMAMPRGRVQDGGAVRSSALPRQTCNQQLTRIIACTSSTKRVFVGIRRLSAERLSGGMTSVQVIR